MSPVGRQQDGSMGSVLEYAGHKPAISPFLGFNIGWSPLDIPGEIAHVVTHPTELPGDFVKLLAHPGQIAEPLAYAAMLALGPVGIAYAYTADKAGVLDGLAKAIDVGGGIFIKLIGTVIFQKACSWALAQVGLGELALGCFILSLAVELARAVVDKKPRDILDVIERISIWAQQYGIDVSDAVKTLLQTVFQALGSEAIVLFGSLESIREALLQVLPVSQANYIVQKISENEDDIRNGVNALPPDQRGSLQAVMDASSGPKVDGKTAIAHGLPTGPTSPPLPPPFGPFAAYVRPIADLINLKVSGIPPDGMVYPFLSQTKVLWTQDHQRVILLEHFLNIGTVLAQTDQRIDDFGQMLSHESKLATQWILGHVNDQSFQHDDGCYNRPGTREVSCILPTAQQRATLLRSVTGLTDVMRTVNPSHNIPSPMMSAHGFFAWLRSVLGINPHPSSRSRHG